ncbi:MMPL family transporter [Sphaerochaeta sp. PS]|uniref:efflux RND transporter permease subunit n=1 Tax=Sphaerochaeta sp. PS TaxID=3076336 RepID=UPI0028A379D3|nr:MMPL family transporter [Sphaerochaeta sp. PS]MDT4761912.1 MMPL family transporter [Sphaerochaeta sp. PS]
MRFFSSLAKKPLLILLALVTLLALFVFGIASNASLETDLNKYMPSTHPAFMASDEAEELFNIQDSILLVVEHPTSIYNPGTLEKIKKITEELPQQFPEIREGKVTSLATADNITSSDGDMEVHPFYTEVPTSREDLARLEESVKANSMINGRNVSLDSTATLIIAEIDPDSNATSLQKRLLEYAKSWEGPERLYVAGRPIVEGSLAELGPKDMSIMFPLVILFMIILLYLLLRSVRDTIINMVIVLFGTLFAFGTKALLGIPIYAVDTMIPVMLIAIGVAYGIHMHNAIHHRIQDSPELSRDQLAQSVLKEMIRPIFMAALTTAIGFISLMSSQVLPVRYFGLFAAIGVIAEMLLALILFPASVYLLGIPKKKAKGLTAKQQKPPKDHRWGILLIEKQRWVITLTVLLIILSGYGATKVWIDTSFLANFEPDSPIAMTDAFVNKKFGGTSSLNIILSSDEEGVFKEPAVLLAMDELQTRLAKDPMVGSTFSLTTFLKQMNLVMHDNDTSFWTIPESRDLVAQYLLLYEFSGDPETLEKVIDYDYTKANITFQLKSDSSAVLGSIIELAQEAEAQFASYGITISFAGSGYKAYVFSSLLLKGQIISLVLSFVIVVILLTLLFRNLWVGLAGTVPIAITAVVNFGVMGLLDIPLSSATALISSIAVGIGVDYSIHLLEHYTNRRLKGYDIEQATKETLSHTGRAIILNAIAVMGGFAVLLFSVFPPNRQVGALIVLNMAMSATLTLTILIVIINHLDKRGLLLPRNIRKDQTIGATTV